MNLVVSSVPWLLCGMTALGLFEKAGADVWVYPAPDESFCSQEYSVVVKQGDHSFASFLYADACQDEQLRDRMTDFNHWTSFSFSGAVTVEVTCLKREVAAAAILPSARGIKPQVSGRTVKFDLTQPGQFWVKLPGAEENPLFIFANPPEADLPDRQDPNVIWFEAGKVTDIGERFEIKSGQTVYLPGGAYVKGTITAADASNVTIRGRGILSGLGHARRATVQGIPYNTIMLNGRGTNQLVEGITITDPQHFCILSRGQLAVRNVKLFGWWHQTDGWGGGDNSLIEDSFMKVNDDNVKLYGKNQTARRLVIYQQVNGAVFQLGWGSANARNCLAQDIDIIRCENNTKPPSHEGNQPVLNLVKQGANNVVDGLRLERVRIEDDIIFLMGLRQASGTVRNLLLRDIDIHGRVLGTNHLRAVNQGQITGVTLENVRVGGARVSGPSDPALKWSLSGNSAPVQIVPAK